MGALTYQFDLISHLVQRDFRLRYTGTLLGLLWSVALPLIQLLVFVFLFARVVPLDIDGDVGKVHSIAQSVGHYRRQTPSVSETSDGQTC